MGTAAQRATDSEGAVNPDGALPLFRGAPGLVARRPRSAGPGKTSVRQPERGG
jgi:hypothetical protein